METLKALVAVSRAAVELRLRGFSATCGHCLHDPPNAGNGEGCGAAELAHAHARTSRLPWSTCLTRSIALCRSLRRRGMPAVLCIGADLGAQGFRAHAWVELAGRAVNDRPTIDREFTALARNTP